MVWGQPHWHTRFPHPSSIPALPDVLCTCCANFSSLPSSCPTSDNWSSRPPFETTVQTSKANGRSVQMHGPESTEPVKRLELRATALPAKEITSVLRKKEKSIATESFRTHTSPTLPQLSQKEKKKRRHILSANVAETYITLKNQKPNSY